MPVKKQPEMKPESDPVETDLVQRAQTGDREALAELVKLYSPRIYSLALRMMRNSEDAEDVLQETFVLMINKITQFSGRSGFYTWLYRVASNVALGKLREKKYREKTISVDDPEFQYLQGSQLADWPAHLEEKLDDEQFRNCLSRAMEDLPEHYRAVFVMRDLENLSTRETADILKISEANVKIRLMRARLFLRDQLAHHLKCVELPYVT